MKSNSKIFLIIFIFCFCASRLWAADQISDATDGSRLVLLGKAVKKFLTFRVVSVDLYIATNHTADQLFEDIPKRIEVLYHVNIPKPELDRATLKGIEKNVSAQQLMELMPQIEQMNSYYSDVESGDKIVITYTPGSGSEVRVKGQIKGVVRGKDFADAFFAIWVGKNPVDPKAKMQLLGKKS